MNYIFDLFTTPRHLATTLAAISTIGPVFEKFGFADWHPWVCAVVFGAAIHYIADGINWKKD